MSRKHALIAAILGAITFAVVYFWPETARAGPAAAPGASGRLHLGDRAVLSGQRSVAVPVYEPYPRHRPKPGTRRTLPPRKPPVLVVPFPVWPERVIVREKVVREQVVSAPVPASAAAALAAPPAVTAAPDPRGRARTVAAPGSAPREWVLGAVLPPDVPHVALDPSAYGLPTPPEGQIYARVDDDVLRIEAGTRRIIGILAQ